MTIKKITACGFPEHRHDCEREEEYMRETEAAAYILVSTYTLRRWRRLGHIDGRCAPSPKAYKLGCHIWYKRSDLEEWIATGQIKHFWLPPSGRVRRRRRR